MGKLVSPEEGYIDPFEICYSGEPPTSQARIDEYAECVRGVRDSLPPEQQVMYTEGFIEEGYDIDGGDVAPPTVTQLQPVELMIGGSGFKFSFGSDAANMAALFGILFMVLLGILAWKGNLIKLVEALKKRRH